MFGLSKKNKKIEPKTKTEKEIFNDKIKLLCKKSRDKASFSILILTNLLYETENVNLYYKVKEELCRNIDQNFDNYLSCQFKELCSKVEELIELNQEYKSILNGIDKFILDRCYDELIEEFYEYSKFYRKYDFNSLNDSFIMMTINEEEENKRLKEKEELERQQEEKRREEILKKIKV